MKTSPFITITAFSLFAALAGCQDSERGNVNSAEVENRPPASSSNIGTPAATSSEGTSSEAPSTADPAPTANITAPSDSSTPESASKPEYAAPKSESSQATLPSSTSEGAPETGVQTRKALLFSTSVVGSRIKSAKGNEVGKIKDLLFDPDNRRIVYVIVALANKDIAVPLSAIKIDPEKHNYTMDVSEDTLAQAPRVEKDKRPATEGEPARQEGSQSATTLKDSKVRPE